MVEEQSVEDVLQFAERLALATNEAAGIVAFDIQQQPFLEVVFFNGHVGKTEVMEQLFQQGFRFGMHISNLKCE